VAATKAYVVPCRLGIVAPKYLFSTGSRPRAPYYIPGYRASRGGSRGV